MSTTFAHRSVKEVPQLSAVGIPIYVPTDLIPRISGLPITLSIAEIQSEACQTGEANYDATLNIFRKANIAPLQLQTQILRSIRAKCEADLPELDAEIMRLQNSIVNLSQQLADVSAKRVQKQNIASSCTSFLSPLRRLPSEMLEEIFFHCLPSHRRPIATEAPLSLIHVCSAWRKVALDFPLLWTDLALATTHYTRMHTTIEDVVDTMNLWFDCARDCPLRFRLRFESLYHLGTGADEAEAITESLILRTHRLQQLHLSATSVDDISKFLALPPGPFNLLESLSLAVSDCQSLERVVTTFEKAPLLREVTFLLGVCPYPAFNLPWHQLTSVTINGMAIYQTEMLSILHACDKLVSAAFYIRTVTEDRVLDCEPCVLGNLVDLKIMFSIEYLETPIFAVLDKLTCPALTRLILDGNHMPLAQIHLSNFLQWAYNLQVISLIFFDATLDDLLSILQATPGLATLNLELDYLYHQYGPLIEAHTYFEGQPNTYVPSLKNLNLNVSALPNDSELFFHERAFITMVQSRQIRQASPAPVAYLSVRLLVKSYGNPSAPNPGERLAILENAVDEGVIDIRLDFIEGNNRLFTT